MIECTECGEPLEVIPADESPLCLCCAGFARYKVLAEDAPLAGPSVESLAEALCYVMTGCESTSWADESEKGRDDWRRHAVKLRAWLAGFREAVLATADTLPEVTEEMVDVAWQMLERRLLHSAGKHDVFLALEAAFATQPPKEGK